MMVSSGSMVSVPDSSVRSWWVCNSLTVEFPYSFGQWRCLLNGPAKGCSGARSGAQAIPVEADRGLSKMLALVTSGCISRSRRGGLVGFKSRKSTTGHPYLPLQSNRRRPKSRLSRPGGPFAALLNEFEMDFPRHDIGGDQADPDLGSGHQLPGAAGGGGGVCNLDDSRTAVPVAVLPVAVPVLAVPVAVLSVAVLRL